MYKGMYHFFISQNNEFLGQMSQQEVALGLETGKLGEMTQYFDSTKGLWQDLKSHPLFGLYFNDIVPNVKAKTLASLNHPEWYICSDSNDKMGPFSPMQIIEMLQKKKISPLNLAWRQDLPQWQPIFKLTSFLPNKVKELQNISDEKIQSLFAQRKFPRAPLLAGFVTHSQNQMWKAKSFEIGEGGIGLIIENPNLDFNTEIFMHMVTNSNLGPFSAVAQIVAKSQYSLSNSTPNKLPNNLAQYGLEFTDVHRETILKIKDFIQLTNQKLQLKQMP